MSVLKETKLRITDIHTSPLLIESGGVSDSTIDRYISTGLRGVRLETVRVGKTLWTSEEAIVRFFDAVEARKKRRSVTMTAAEYLK